MLREAPCVKFVDGEDAVYFFEVVFYVFERDAEGDRFEEDGAAVFD